MVEKDKYTKVVPFLLHRISEYDDSLLLLKKSELRVIEDTSPEKFFHVYCRPFWRDNATCS